jgi:hypothetical protein
MRRLMLNMSQTEIGDALGLTFQQVQKYEKGANRISASRLQHLCQILKVPVTFFFEGDSFRSFPARRLPNQRSTPRCVRVQDAGCEPAQVDGRVGGLCSRRRSIPGSRTSLAESAKRTRRVRKSNSRIGPYLYSPVLSHIRTTTRPQKEDRGISCPSPENMTVLRRR